LVALVAALFAGAGCTSSSPVHAGSRAPGAAVPEAVGYLARVAADAKSLARITTSFQAAILADGRVTPSEYKRATYATAACLRRAAPGVRVGPVRREAGGELHFDWVVTGSGGARAGRSFERCQSLYRNDVALIYSNQRVIPPTERPHVLRRLVACLRAEHLKVPTQPSMQELVALLDADTRDASAPCVRRFFDLFRLPAPVRRD
jgi:hypothetical protein